MPPHRRKLPPDAPLTGHLVIRDVLASVIEPATRRAYREGYTTIDDVLKVFLYEYSAGKVYPFTEVGSRWDGVSPQKRQALMQQLARGRWRKVPRADRKAHMRAMAQAKWKKQRAQEWAAVQAAARALGTRVRARVWPLEPEEEE